MMGLVIGLAIAGAVVIGTWFGIRRIRDRFAAAANRMASLLQEGAATSARVTAVEKRRTSRHDFEYYVTYAFRTRDGRDVEKELRVSATHFNDFQTGQTIDVVYLQSDPSVSATRGMVETVRRAQLDGG